MNTSFIETSFLGGEWSSWAQGRFDLPKYRQSMNVCLNAIPLEEGACTRRGGTQRIAPTRSGNPGRVIGWEFTEDKPYVVEFTDNHLRFFNGNLMVVGTDAQNVSSFSGGITTVGAHGWATGDQVVFLVSAASPTASVPTLRNQQATITVTGATTFTIVDSVTGAALVVASGDVLPTTEVQVARITDLPTVWAGSQWATLRMIPTDTNQSVCLTAGVVPYSITVTNPTTTPAFSLLPVTLIDGPYLPVVSGAIATLGGTQGVVSLVMTFQGWSVTNTYAIGDFVSFASGNFVSLKNANLGVAPLPNGVTEGFWAFTNSGAPFGPNGAQASDVGRLMRLFYQPIEWDAATAYASGTSVSFHGAYYTAISGNTGEEPDLNLNAWQPNAGIAYWIPAIITAVTSATVVSVQLTVAPLDLTPIVTFRVGLYSPSSGYPTLGCYASGRLWMAGAKTNRIDASSTDDVFTFAPTGSDGTVADNNAISLVLNTFDNESVQWMHPVQGGILVGTNSREFLIRASTTQDPITPATADVQPITKYGGAFVEAREAGLGTIFVQRHGLQVMEMVANVFSGRYNAPNLAMPAKHLMAGGIEEMAYTEEPAPVLWARTGNGVLVGCTYRRLNAFQTDNPAVLNEPSTFAAWHHHTFGTGRLVKSITKTLLPDASLDQLWMTTQASAGGAYWVEALTPIPQITDTFFDAWFLDSAETPSGSATVIGPQGLGTRFYGFNYLSGQQVAVWAAGLDCGNFTVSPTGYVDVPFGSASGLYTEAYVNAIAGSGYRYGLPVDETVTPAPPPLSASPMMITAYQPELGINAMPDSGSGVANFGNDRILSVNTSNSATSGLRTYVLAGSETGEVTTKELLSSTSSYSAAFDVVRSPQDGGGLVAADGNYYMISRSITDHSFYGMSPLQRIDLSTMKVTATFFSPLQPPGALMAPIENPSGAVGINSNTYAIGSCMCNGFCYGAFNQSLPARGGGAITVFNLTNMTYAGFRVNPVGGNNEEIVLLANGYSGAEFGTIIAVDTWQDASSVPSFNLYQITVQNGTQNLADVAQTNAGILPQYVTQHTITTDQYGSLATAWTPGSYITGNLAWNFGTPFTATEGTNLEPGYSNMNGWSEIPNPNISMETKANYTPAMFDPTWIGIETVSNIVYDQGDGNILMIVKGYGGNGDTLLVKVSGYNGAIIWKQSVSLYAPLSQHGVPNMNLVNGVLTYVDTGGNAHILNSITGAPIFSFSIPGITVGTSYQTCDSVGGRIVFWGDYNGSVPGAPTPTPGTPGSLTGAWFSLTAGNAFQGVGSVTSRLTIPAVVGIPFTTQGQIVRPVLPQEAGTPHGPAQGELRRVVQFSALLSNTQGISFGTDFASSLVPAILWQFRDGPPLPLNEGFTGVYAATMNDTYSYDGMPAWQISRPYPATVVNIGGFLTTSEK